MVKIRETNKNQMFGIVDVDLLDNGTRHPNLVLMKIAGYLRDQNISYQFIFEDSTDINNFDYIYASKVFTFSKEPSFLAKFFKKNNLFKGGTGYYAEEENQEIFNRMREDDMMRLENDPLLPNFSMAHQMPDYNLYNKFIEKEIAKGKQLQQYKDYQQFSIGFFTRGCIRKCPFCINRNINYVYNYSKLEDFVDNDRPRIYLWDDNFLAAKNWKELLLNLKATKKPFQFRQGLDMRLMTEEKAEMLSKCNYYGDYIFAFDQWEERFIIEKKLKIWKSYCATKTTKFYLFCGFELTETDDDKFFEDVFYLFKRIEFLMSFGCLSYVMRHEDYKNHPLGNIYTQIARWCNQPQFYKKMSFKEFIDRNQSYQEEHSNSKNICKSLRTYNCFKNKYSYRWSEIEPLFTMKYQNTINSLLWEEQVTNTIT